MRLFFMFCTLLLSTIGFSQTEVSIGTINNKIAIGPLVGNRNLTFGVKNIVEEVLQERGYDLLPDSNITIDIDLLYFDVKKTSLQVAIYNQTVDETEITAQAFLKENGKVKKKVIAKGLAKSTSVATLIVDEGGKFSQSDVSTALKKVCEDLIVKLKI